MRLFTSLIFVFIVSAACSTGLDIPMEYPTPPPPAQATPAPPLLLQRDPELEQDLAAIAIDAKGEVGIAAVVLETGDAAQLNADERFPMQSVYKLPIAMAVLEEVRRGRRGLDEKVGVTKDDMVRKGMRSPLRDANPDGGEYTIRELVRLSMVESDGTASDVLMRVLGEEGNTQAFLTRIGIFEIKVVDPTKEIGREWNIQYRNYATPAAAVELLRWLKVSVEAADAVDAEDPVWPLLVQFMTESKTGVRRIQGQLPKGTLVANKTGTSGTQNGITPATNDIGIIELPDGRHIAIAVFVSDSTANEATREAVIARMAKAVWDRWAKMPSPE